VRILIATASAEIPRCKLTFHVGCPCHRMRWHELVETVNCGIPQTKRAPGSARDNSEGGTSSIPRRERAREWRGKDLLKIMQFTYVSGGF